MGQYQTDPGAIRNANFNASPNRQITTTSQGKESHPTPPKQFSGANGPKLPAPTSVQAPGASGTI